MSIVARLPTRGAALARSAGTCSLHLVRSLHVCVFFWPFFPFMVVWWVHLFEGGGVNRNQDLVRLVPPWPLSAIDTQTRVFIALHPMSVFFSFPCLVAS